jgi:hypothetical protein
VQDSVMDLTGGRGPRQGWTRVFTGMVWWFPSKPPPYWVSQFSQNCGQVSWFYFKTMGEVCQMMGESWCLRTDKIKHPIERLLEAEKRTS